MFDRHPSEEATTFLGLFDEIPPIDSLGFSYEGRMVYLRWLGYLSRGPGWDALDPQTKIDVILRLRAWISEQADVVAAKEAQPPSLFALLTHGKDQPNELLKLVGHEYAYWELWEAPPDEEPIARSDLRT